MARGSRARIVLGALASCLTLGLPAPAVAAPPAFVLHSDVPTGITSDTDVFVSLRYMRHLWVMDDGLQVTVVQQGSNGGLGLYTSADDGRTWSWQQDLPSTADDVSDGVVLDDGSLLLVTSIIGSDPGSGVDFLLLNYDAPTQQWSLDPLGPTTVYASNQVARASRATLAMDGNGVLWCAFRLQNTNSGNFRLRLFYSEDDGLTWQDSLVVLGTANGFAEKDAKVIAAGTGIAVVFQDIQGTATNPIRVKGAAFRDDSAAPQSTMTSQIVAQMSATTGDPHGSHWSVAADSFGDVHLSYQDDRIFHARYDTSVQSWSTPMALGTSPGSYNSVTVAGDDDVWVFARLGTGGNMWVKRRTAVTGQWTGWVQISTGPHTGLLRMCSPERVDNRLPLLYQVNETAPFELLHCLLAV